MRRALFALLAALLAGAALATPTALAAKPGTIAQLAASSPKLSTLARLVRAARLARALSGSSKLTVFAPTNAAFAKVPQRTLDALANDRAALRRVLLYHVVSGAVPARKVVQLHSIRTLAGPKLTVHVSGRTVRVNDARVVQADVKASNGIIHVIDRVLIPRR